MTLSRSKLATALTFFDKPQNKQPSSTSLGKIATALGLCLGLAPWAQAQLPAEVESALSRANISSDDISLVIMPVSSDSNNAANSNLPEVIKPELIKTVEPESAHDADALPPEQSNTAEIKTSVASTAPSTHKNSQPTKPSSNTAPSATNTVDQATSDNGGQSEVIETTYSPLQFPMRHLADLPRTPASTMKLIPTFVALDLLGPDFVWFTKVYHTGFVSGNTLYGDLIIKGSGDPKLTTQRLNKLLERVQQSGIQHIKGDIVLDSSVFQGVTKDPAAFDNDPLRPYNASPDGLLINFSSVEVNAVPLLNESNKGLSKLYYKPRLADFDLPSILATTGAGRCTIARSTLAPVWQNEGLKFNRKLPESCGNHSFYIAYPDAKEFAKRVVKNQWLTLGNTLSGNIKFLGLGNTVSGDMINTEHPIKTSYGSYLDMSANPDKEALLAQSLSILPSSPLPFVSYPSLPLSSQIFDINHYSNNVMAEQITLTLPLYTKIQPQSDKQGAPNSTRVGQSKQHQQSDYQTALATINHWWQQNLTSMPPVMTNGSGLCRDCSVTAENLAELLTFAYNHPDFKSYVNSLGIAGISGTIEAHAERKPDSKAIGRAWIKTGTLRNVTSMAGYVHSQSGQDYVVVGIINGSNNNQPINTYQARYALDTMLDWTAKH